MAESLGCARCGACCEQIVLGFDPRIPIDNGDPENTELYRDYWTVEWVDDHEPHPPHGHGAWGGVGYVVTCKAYDPDRRLCTHPARPPICRDYPHYGATDKAPDRVTVRDQAGAVQPFGCSYGLDVPGWSQQGRPLIPLEVVRG